MTKRSVSKQQKAVPDSPTPLSAYVSWLFNKRFQRLIQPSTNLLLRCALKVALAQEQRQLIFVHTIHGLNHGNLHVVINLNILTFHISALIAHMNRISPMIIHNHICSAFRTFHNNPSNSGFPDRLFLICLYFNKLQRLCKDKIFTIYSRIFCSYLDRFFQSHFPYDS